MAELALTELDEVEYIGELEQTIKTQKDLIEALKKQVGELERQMEAQCEEVGHAGEQITELARIRTALKQGRHDEGRDRLERVLGDLNSSWRTRA